MLLSKRHGTKVYGPQHLYFAWHAHLIYSIKSNQVIATVKNQSAKWICNGFLWIWLPSIIYYSKWESFATYSRNNWIKLTRKVWISHGNAIKCKMMPENGWSVNCVWFVCLAASKSVLNRKQCTRTTNSIKRVIEQPVIN